MNQTLGVWRVVLGGYKFCSFMFTKCVLFGCCLTLVGCMDEVTTTYPTRVDAEADALFIRGWLPSVIPPSSREIMVQSNLDLNRAHGEFHADKSELEKFSGKLKRTEQRCGATELADIGMGYRSIYQAYSYTDDGSTWTFCISFEREHVRFSMRPVDSGAVD